MAQQIKDRAAARVPSLGWELSRPAGVANNRQREGKRERKGRRDEDERDPLGKGWRRGESLPESRGSAVLEDEGRQEETSEMNQPKRQEQTREARWGCQGRGGTALQEGRVARANKTARRSNRMKTQKCSLDVKERLVRFRGPKETDEREKWVEGGMDEEFQYRGAYYTLTS